MHSRTFCISHGSVLRRWGVAEVYTRCSSSSMCACTIAIAVSSRRFQAGLTHCTEDEPHRMHLCNSSSANTSDTNAYQISLERASCTTATATTTTATTSNSARESRMNATTQLHSTPASPVRLLTYSALTLVHQRQLHTLHRLLQRHSCTRKSNNNNSSSSSSSSTNRDGENHTCSCSALVDAESRDTARSRMSCSRTSLVACSVGVELTHSHSYGDDDDTLADSDANRIIFENTVFSNARSDRHSDTTNGTIHINDACNSHIRYTSSNSSRACKSVKATLSPRITYLTGVNHALHVRVNKSCGTLRGILKGCAEQNALGAVAAQGLPYTAVCDVYLLSTLAPTYEQQLMCDYHDDATTEWVSGTTFPCPQCWAHLRWIATQRAQQHKPALQLFVGCYGTRASAVAAACAKEQSVELKSGNVEVTTVIL